MAVNFADYSCQEPDILEGSCRRNGIPTAPWYGLCNSFTNPIGIKPGRGHLLLLRGILDKIILSEYQTLEFASYPSNSQQSVLKLAAVRVVGAPMAITPGYPGDEATAFLVEVADRRIDCVGLANKRYNWRMMPDVPHDSTSLNSGSAWTWAEMLEDLWDAVGNLGDFPDLPRTPDGTPQQIDARACLAADVLQDLLLLNGLSIYYDVFADTFTIIDIGDDSFADYADTLLEKYMDVRCWDQEFQHDAATIPAYVRVAFPVWSMGGTPIDHGSYFRVDVANETGEPDEEDSYVLIQDFTACRTNQVGTSLNTSELATRAADIAEQWYKRATLDQFTPLARSLSGAISDSDLMPGQLFDAVIWSDTGKLGTAPGPVTHLIRHGRIGNIPIVKPSGWTADTTGAIASGHPSSEFSITTDSSAVSRAGSFPPGEVRERQGGPFFNQASTVASLVMRVLSPILDRVGPIRQWDAAAMAMAVGGDGRRLWAPHARTQFQLFVKVTSVTAVSGRYPAIEVLKEPVAGTWTNGDVCWYEEANGGVPDLNTYHLCYLNGTDGGSPAKKVYQDAADAGANCSKVNDCIEFGQSVTYVEKVCAPPKTLEFTGVPGGMDIKVDGVSILTAGAGSVDVLTGLTFQTRSATVPSGSTIDETPQCHDATLTECCDEADYIAVSGCCPGSLYPKNIQLTFVDVTAVPGHSQIYGCAELIGQTCDLTWDAGNNWWLGTVDVVGCGDNPDPFTFTIKIWCFSGAFRWGWTGSVVCHDANTFGPWEFDGCDMADWNGTFEADSCCWGFVSVVVTPA